MADQVTEFFKAYPGNNKLPQAHSLHRYLLREAALAGDVNARQQFERMVECAADLTLPERDRFELRLERLFLDGAKWGDASLELPARALIEDFPEERRAYLLLLAVANSASEPCRRALAEEIANMEHVPGRVKIQARSRIKNSN